MSKTDEMRAERVRVLLLSPRRRVLLIKYRNTQASGATRPCWTTAGGGCEAGETVVEAARREVLEETGMRDVSFGPVVWYCEDRDRSGDWGFVFREHFIVAFAADEEIQREGWTDHERQQILETRWWSVDELLDARELIYPPNLGRLVEPLLDGRYPDRVITLPPVSKATP